MICHKCGKDSKRMVRNICTECHSKRSSEYYKRKSRGLPVKSNSCKICNAKLEDGNRFTLDIKEYTNVEKGGKIRGIYKKAYIDGKRFEKVKLCRNCANMFMRKILEVAKYD